MGKRSEQYRRQILKERSQAQLSDQKTADTEKVDQDTLEREKIKAGSPSKKAQREAKREQRLRDLHAASKDQENSTEPAYSAIPAPRI